MVFVLQLVRIPVFFVGGTAVASLYMRIVWRLMARAQRRAAAEPYDA